MHDLLVTECTYKIYSILITVETLFSYQEQITIVTFVQQIIFNVYLELILYMF